MAQDKIIVGGNVEGNVTSCENKQIIAGIDRKGAFSLKQTESILVYNQCTGAEVSRYQYESLSGFGFVFGILVVAIILTIIASIWSNV